MHVFLTIQKNVKNSRGVNGNIFPSPAKDNAMPFGTLELTYIPPAAQSGTFFDAPLRPGE